MKREKFTYQFWAIVLIFTGIVISSIYMLLIFKGDLIKFNQNIDLNKFSTIGDFIGGVIGSLWTLAGVFLFFQALKEQNKDSETNISLLKTQIEELETTKKTAEEQSKILRLQQFETSFFSLFNFFNATTNDLEVKSVKGKKIFEIISRELTFTAKEKTNTGISLSIWADVSLIEDYQRIYEEMQEILQPYFGVLYRLLKFIDNSNLEIVEKYRYSKILRSYLTNSELLVLRYHWLTPFGGQFTELLKRYNILKELPISIRPEFIWHKLKLAEISPPNLIRPFDLYGISEAFNKCLLKAYFDKSNECWHTFPVSYIKIGVVRKENILDITIKVPTIEYLKKLYKEYYKDYAESYASSVEKLLDYDICQLIEELVYAKLVNDNFYILEYKETETVYTIVKDVSMSIDKSRKIFRCIVTFHDIKKFWVPYDIDDLTRWINNEDFNYERSQINTSGAL